MDGVDSAVEAAIKAVAKPRGHISARKLVDEVPRSAPLGEFFL